MTHNGAPAVRSGAITHRQDSILSARYTGPGVLSFWWKSCSESSDKIFFNAYDRDFGVSLNRSLGGQNDWQFVTVPVYARTCDLTWDDSKDSSVRSGLDAGWSSEDSFSNDPPVAPAIDGPIRFDSAAVRAGSNMMFKANLKGTPSPIHP